MLDTIRRRKSVFLWFILIPIAVVFVFWGIGGRTTGPLDPGQAASVNGTDIASFEVAEEQSRLEERYRQLFGGQLPPGLLEPEAMRAQAIENLVTRTLLKQEAKRQGLRVTDEEVRQYIVGQPAFQQNGQFDRNTYLYALSQGLAGPTLRTPAAYEAAVRDEIAFRRLSRLVTDSASVIDAEARQAFHNERDKVSLEVVRVPATPDPKATFPENELQAYYDARRGQYERPARVTALVARVEPAKVAAQVTVTDDELKAAFERRKDDLGTPPEVNARHLLVKVDEQADQKTVDAARARAQAALDRIKKGEDFGKVALEVSEDPSRGNDPKSAGSLGWFGPGAMVKAFEEAAFSLEPGQVSDLVRSPFGFHVIRVEQRREGKPATLEGTRDKVLADLKAERATRRAGELADQLAIAAAKSGDLTAEARALGVPTRTVGPILSTQPPAGLSPEVAREALRLDQGRVSPPFQDGASWVVLQATAKTEASTAPLAEVLDSVKAGLARQKAAAAARERAAAILEAARKSSLAAAAKQAALAVQTTGLFERRAREIPRLGPAPAVAEAAFKLSKASPFPAAPVALGDDALVIRLAAREAADPAADPDGLARVTRSLAQEKGNAAFQQFIDALRSKASITIDPAYRPKAPVLPAPAG